MPTNLAARESAAGKGFSKICSPKEAPPQQSRSESQSEELCRLAPDVERGGKPAFPEASPIRQRGPTNTLDQDPKQHLAQSQLAPNKTGTANSGAVSRIKSLKQ